MQYESSQAAAAAVAMRRRDSLDKAGFNPAEPRDARARWTRDAGGGSTAAYSTAAYQGRFHDLVVDDFLDGLRSQGSSVLKNVRVLGLNGVLAIPERRSRLEGTSRIFLR